MDKIRVAVRVRPINRRELELGTECVVDIHDKQTVLARPTQPAGRKSTVPPAHNDSAPDVNANRGARTFAFDECFDSKDADSLNYASQELVYEKIGRDIVDNAFQGYNGCIFAYGQTGSGKSYTMMGSENDRGLIPRLAEDLFHRIVECTDSSKVEVSYMEIYNEKVHDLLDPDGCKSLKVREHQILGPYVDGLTKAAVTCYEDVELLIGEGNRSRTIAATNMNAESSRSHAVFTMVLTTTLIDHQSGTSGERVARISLVDLAGSERASKSGAVGERLREGSNINKSLTTLGLVISKLAEQSTTSKSKDNFVPYRDSVLTWLLKDNLGGNSRTVMIAAVSPAGDNYEETLSTLRYADRAKRIVNHARVNEDPRARIIRELRAEVEELRKRLNDAQAGRQQSALEEKLTESKKLMREYSETWEEKLAKSERMQLDRHRALERQGLFGVPHAEDEGSDGGPQSLLSFTEKSPRASGVGGLRVSKELFSLVNLNADPSLDGVLLYYLKERTLVGRRDASIRPDIELSGLGIQAEHCVLTIEEENDGNFVPGPENEASRALFVIPKEGARTCLNGKPIHSKTRLKHGDRIVWGNHHFYRVNCPGGSTNEVGDERQKVATDEVDPSPIACLDYDFARRELERNEMKEDPIHLVIADLEKQHEEDKQAALHKQRQDYERQMQNLKNTMSPSGSQFGQGSSMPASTPSSIRGSTHNLHSRMEKWTQDRDERFRKGLAMLKECIYAAKGLVREANSMASEMALNTTFKLTLRIPAESLTPYGTKKGGLMSEPAVLVKRKGKPAQIWSAEKMEHKLVDMREAYDEFQRLNRPLAVWREQAESTPALLTTLSEPFWESQESHTLIGVANFFLEVLFQDVALSYDVPIISQQGEVAGKLQVEIARIAGKLPDLESIEAGGSEDDMSASTTSAASTTSSSGSWRSQSVTVRVRIKRASGLPAHLSNFVFCQYSLWGGEPVVVGPTIPGNGCDGVGLADGDDGGDTPEEVFAARRRHGLMFNRHSVRGDRGAVGDKDESNLGRATFYFDHSRDFIVPLSEEFLDHCIEDALSIQVWGHRIASHSSGSTSSGFPFVSSVDLHKSAFATRSLQERWNEVRRQLEVWVGIQELNDDGEYVDVDVDASVPGIICGGVHLLKQGLQRRVVVSVDTVPDSGMLPLVCDAITSVSIGNVVARHAAKSGLDSYQEEDLQALREKWRQLWARRKKYLEKQMQDLMNKSDKTESETEREQHLIGQWVALTEENNGIQVPSPGSGIPGAPLSPTYQPPAGLEKHIPVLFLDIKDDFQYLEDDDGASVGFSEVEGGLFAGLNSVVPHETWGPSIPVPIVSRQYSENGPYGSSGDDGSVVAGFHNGARAELGATCVWDSSIHTTPHLNRVTPPNERIYLVVKVCLRLAHPVTMEVMLRKRICVQICKKNQGLSLTGLMKRFGRQEKLNRTGVRYEIVSNIPKASEELEDRETLAQMAAEEEDAFALDGETYIEQYTKGLGVVDNLLALDRLRQSLAVKERLQAKGATPTMINSASSNFMRKTVSVPNIAMLGGSGDGAAKSESVADFGALVEAVTLRQSADADSGSTPPSRLGGQPPTRPKSLFSANFSIAKSGFTSVMSPSSGGGRMTTLHEEDHAISADGFVRRGSGSDRKGEKRELALGKGGSRDDDDDDEGCDSSTGTSRSSQGREEESRANGGEGRKRATNDYSSDDGCRDDSTEDNSVNKQARTPSIVSSPLPPLSSSSSGYMSQQSVVSSGLVASTSCSTLPRSNSMMDPLGIREFCLDEDPSDAAIANEGPEKESTEVGVEEEDDKAGDLPLPPKPGMLESSEASGGSSSSIPATFREDNLTGNP